MIAAGVSAIAAAAAAFTAETAATAAAAALSGFFSPLATQDAADHGADYGEQDQDI